MSDLRTFENHTLGPWDAPLPESIIERQVFVTDKELDQEYWTLKQPLEFYKGMMAACGVLQTYITNVGKIGKVCEVNMQMLSDLSIIIANKMKSV